MTRVVLDTNVLVSALWTPAGNASMVASLVLTGKVTLCFDTHILEEYRAVLHRPRLAFPSGQVESLLHALTNRGFSVMVPPSTIALPDEADRKFYDVARYCRAYLVTGNIRHYPKEANIMTPALFLEMHAN